MAEAAGDAPPPKRPAAELFSGDSDSDRIMVSAHTDALDLRGCRGVPRGFRTRPGFLGGARAAPRDSLPLQEVHASPPQVSIPTGVARTQFVSQFSAIRSLRRALAPPAAPKLGRDTVAMSLRAAKRSLKGTASGEASPEVSGPGDLKSNTLLALHFAAFSKEGSAPFTVGSCSSNGDNSRPLTLRDRLPLGAAGGFAAAGGTLAEDVSACTAPEPSARSREGRLAVFRGSRCAGLAAGPAASAEIERTTFLLRLRHKCKVLCSCWGPQQVDGLVVLEGAGEGGIDGRGRSGEQE